MSNPSASCTVGMGSVGSRTFALAFGLRLRFGGAGGLGDCVSSGRASASVPSAFARSPSTRPDGRMSPDERIISRFEAHRLVQDRLGGLVATEYGRGDRLKSIW
jgi:hypothetical protein